MSDLTNDQIRELLELAMTDSPEPHPWADIQHRAAHDDSPVATRRSWVWLAAAACTIALVAGFVVLIDSDDDKLRIDDEPVPTTPTTPETTPTTTDAATTTSTTTVPEVEAAGWSGGLLDDLDTGTLRPLDGYTDGDAIIPTGPSGWRVESSQWGTGDGPESTEWFVNVSNALPDRGFEEQLLQVMLTDKPCGFTRLCTRTGESVTIDGVVWESLVPEGVEEGTAEFVGNMQQRAAVGDRWVFLALSTTQYLDGTPLEEPEVIEFLEGLRVGSPEVLRPIGEACWQCGVAGAEGDPFSVTESSDAAPTGQSEPATTPEPQPPELGEMGSDTGRSLVDIADGDVLIATYLPLGVTSRGEAQIHEYATGDSAFHLEFETADPEHWVSVGLWDFGEDLGPFPPSELDDPNHPPVEIAGTIWVWNDFEMARITRIGRFSVTVHLGGLEPFEARQFIEGLRAVSVEEYSRPITVDGDDGLTVLNDPADAEIVASDDQFELTAVRVGDEVCTSLEQTTDPVTMTFAANCWEPTRFTEPGIVDFVPLDETDTIHLIIGAMDAPGATAVQITSPSGESVVVPTGPVNEAIDGRFFLVRLVIDIDNGIRLDQFTIEDVSP